MTSVQRVYIRGVATKQNKCFAMETHKELINIEKDLKKHAFVPLISATQKTMSFHFIYTDN